MSDQGCNNQSIKKKILVDPGLADPAYSWIQAWPTQHTGGSRLGRPSIHPRLLTVSPQPAARTPETQPPGLHTPTCLHPDPRPPNALNNPTRLQPPPTPHTWFFSMGRWHLGHGLVLARIQLRFSHSALFLVIQVRTVLHDT